MAAPGWPKDDIIPEATAIQIDADSSHHGSYHGSHNGSRHGSRQASRHDSQHGSSSYAQALQTSCEPSRSEGAAKLERRASRSIDNAGTNDSAQDYAGDCPIERDNQARRSASAKTNKYDPKMAMVTYFKKWIGGIDEVITAPFHYAATHLHT